MSFKPTLRRQYEDAKRQSEKWQGLWETRGKELDALRKDVEQERSEKWDAQGKLGEASLLWNAWVAADKGDESRLLATATWSRENFVKLSALLPPPRQ